MANQWGVVKSFTNCGSKQCRMGCWDEINECKTDEKPHGAYYTLQRRRPVALIESSEDKRPFDRIRVGRFEVTPAVLALINISKDLCQEINWDEMRTTPKRKAFYVLFRLRLATYLHELGHRSDHYGALTYEFNRPKQKLS